MDDMVERVARAIERADGEFGYSINLVRLVDGVSTYALKFSELPGDTFELGSYHDALDMMTERRKRVRAKAAIEAMREPTEAQCYAAMQEARRAVPPALPACKELWASKLVWSTMIDAALQSPPQ